MRGGRFVLSFSPGGGRDMVLRVYWDLVRIMMTWTPLPGDGAHVSPLPGTSKGREYGAFAGLLGGPTTRSSVFSFPHNLDFENTVFLLCRHFTCGSKY